MLKISEFVVAVLNDRSNTLQKLKLSIVSAEIAEIILSKTGINITGYTHIVDSFGVKHALKNHSNLRKEQLRGLIPITLSDFDRIPEIVENFDEVVYSGKNKAGRHVITYVKKYNGYIYYAEEIRSPKKQEAVIQTMYIKPNKNNV